VPASRAEILEAARLRLEMSAPQLWVDYVSLGGSLSPLCIQGYLNGRGLISDHDHDILVQALNERFADFGGDQPLAYADELPSQS
jgi:hypothetical protein